MVKKNRSPAETQIWKNEPCRNSLFFKIMYKTSIYGRQRTIFIDVITFCSPDRSIRSIFITENETCSLATDGLKE